MDSLVLSRTGRLILPSSLACVRRLVASVYDSRFGKGCSCCATSSSVFTGVFCIMMLFSRFVALWMSTGLPVPESMADMTEFVKLIERRGDLP